MTDNIFERLHTAFMVRSLPQDKDLYSEEAVLASLKFQKLLLALESAHRNALNEKDEKEGKQKFN